jgi:Rps23 Pro-64 3,4-dihydroxylase Tpa1-like proline 4-hydroxylase
MSLLSSLPVFRTVTALRQQLADSKEQVRALREKLQAQKEDIGRLKTREQRLRELESGVLDSRRLGLILKREGLHYRTADPFPHVVIDDFLPPELLRRVAEEFASMDRSDWRRSNSAHERKLSTEDESRFGPFTAKVIAALNSGTFLNFLERLTGIGGLIADPFLRGGGLHEIERGGNLGVHADFNFYERLKVYRRLNLLVYLNSSWQEAWGGQLELWTADCRTKAKSIGPVFNRAVIFDTSNKSYHGHPHPLACPEGESRKSIALYYYTTEYPYQEDLAPHSTLFVTPASE